MPITPTDTNQRYTLPSGIDEPSVNENTTKSRFLYSTNELHQYFHDTHKKLQERTVKEIGSKYTLKENAADDTITVTKKTDVGSAYSTPSTNFMDDETISKHLQYKYQVVKHKVDNETFKRLKTANDIIWAVKQALPRGAANQALDNISSFGTNDYAAHLAGPDSTLAKTLYYKAGVCNNYAATSHFIAHHAFNQENINESITPVSIEPMSSASTHKLICIGSNPKTQIIIDAWPDLPGAFLFDHLSDKAFCSTDNAYNYDTSFKNLYQKRIQSLSSTGELTIDEQKDLKQMPTKISANLRLQPDAYPKVLAKQCIVDACGYPKKFRPIICSVDNPKRVYVNKATGEEMRVDTVPQAYLQTSLNAVKLWEQAVTSNHWRSMSKTLNPYRFNLSVGIS